MKLREANQRARNAEKTRDNALEKIRLGQTDEVRKLKLDLKEAEIKLAKRAVLPKLQKVVAVTISVPPKMTEESRQFQQDYAQMVEDVHKMLATQNMTTAQKKKLEAQIKKLKAKLKRFQADKENRKMRKEEKRKRKQEIARMAVVPELEEMKLPDPEDDQPGAAMDHGAVRSFNDLDKVFPGMQQIREQSMNRGGEPSHATLSEAPKWDQRSIFADCDNCSEGSGSGSTIEL